MDPASFQGWGPALYLLMALMVVGDAAVPPIPSEVMVVTSGAMSVTGHLNLALSLTATIAGSLTGDAMVFLLFKRRLNHLLDRWAWGRKVHRGLHAAVLKAGPGSRYAALVAGRFLPAGRTATLAAAGMADAPTRPVLLCCAAGSVLWALWLTGLGYVTGAATNLPFWASSLIGIGVGLVAGAAVTLTLALRRRAARR
ncbi:VTT domain-containing protein [Paenarthrobacter sp. DKR-5]|uniref:DedA family protein n=1 Tax=Paenarthrobacter sp. DKR-5 TaxID=2835535 RepID=UPI001BDC2BB2|nr:VTT domain-containing protein [Paenarthrobacter sp. DKR-5]MBT1003511.1 VTT domain-containing protein [Paenarthrobacter sp. DKR-5]